ncbi:putative ribonuclease H-like domain-containing protein, partial [Tanacetum coccineum]
TWTFYLGTKDETFYVLKEFIALIENQLNKKVKEIRCDNGTEFKNAKLIELCGEKGKFEGKADDGYLVGYASNSKAYRVYNKVDFSLDEHVAVQIENKVRTLLLQALPEDHMPDFHHYDDARDIWLAYGPFWSYQYKELCSEELAKLQRQEYEAKDAAARYGYLFSQETAEILSQAEAEIRNQGVSADRDPAGIDSAGGVSAGNPAGTFQPAGSYDPAALGDPAAST